MKNTGARQAKVLDRGLDRALDKQRTWELDSGMRCRAAAKVFPCYQRGVRYSTKSVVNECKTFGSGS